ncbi:MAG: 4Fe-4S binding protein, partial [Proteobacteria bacterium]|nr:4Fe-4S binding protein [Pseudomonadota bacterium]
IWHWTSGRRDSRPRGTLTAIKRLITVALLQQGVVQRPIGIVHALMFWAFGAMFIIFSLPLVGLNASLIPRVFYWAFNTALIIGGLTLGVRLLFITRKQRKLSSRETGLRLFAPLLISTIGFAHFLTQRGPNFEFLHLSLIAVFFAIIPYSRLLHVFAVPLWLLLRPEQRLAIPTPFNLSQQSEDEIISSDIPLGPRNWRDFPCSTLLAFDACTRCGRCEDACPAVAPDTAFSPAAIMKQLQQNGGRDKTVLPVDIARRFEVDACTSCGLCESVCPVGLEPITAVLELRRSLAYEDEFESGHNDALRRLARRGVMWDPERNPPGVLEGPVSWPPDQSEEAPELIYWLGCSGRHEPRAQEIAKTVASLLDRAGVRWTCAGNAETCTGDPARRMGDEGLFQRQALKVIKLLRQSRARQVLVNCAHCFNAIAKEYPNFGGEFNVIHHTEFLNQLVQTQRLGKLEALPRVIAFHDPCYLGRHNGLFQPARDALVEISGLSIVELEDSRESSKCCGAGGGRLWRQAEPGATMAQSRANQVIASDADTLATGCPFCLSMLEDPVASSGMKIQDISEIIADAIREQR